MYSISLNQAGRVEHIYGPGSPDDSNTRHPITDDEFRQLAERGCNGDFTYSNGQISLSPLPPSAAQLRAEAKVARTAAVAAITVTTSTGKVFDGDETSQTRMARAIIGLQAAQVNTINWTLANNVSTSVTLAELTEALILSGEAQAALWPIPE